MDKLSLHIESLIFASEKPITISDIRSVLCEVMGVEFEIGTIEDGINEVIRKYENPDFAIEVMEMSGGFTFMSKPQYHHTLGQYLKTTSSRKLSKAAMETLAIIAYKHPTTKTDIESIRGVNCDYAIQKLLEKELITILGRSEGPGKPIIYGVSDHFMNYFGLKSIKDLPDLKDFAEAQNAIGEAQE
ncbi:MAG: SMC-Scp complex subunit ScpB [Saprospiraceae bacterium]|nr:SMC-Scp complex subunit ScpB [Saprospiraceae bacterium]